MTDEAGNTNNLLTVPETTAKEHPELSDVAPSLDSSPGSGDEDDMDDQNRPPLMPHERLGANPAIDDRRGSESPPDDAYHRNSRPASRDYTFDEFELHDPTLEKFPSDRGSIMDALRKIQTSMSEDSVHLDDVRSSPRSGAGVNGLELPDDILLSPAALSQTSTRRRESHQTHGSVMRSRSAVSLGSIAEEDRKMDGEIGEGSRYPEMTDTHTGNEDELEVQAASKVNTNSATNTLPLSQTLQSNNAAPKHRHGAEGEPFGATGLPGRATPTSDKEDENGPEASRPMNNTLSTPQGSSTQPRPGGIQAPDNGLLARLCRSLATVLCGATRAT